MKIADWFFLGEIFNAFLLLWVEFIVSLGTTGLELDYFLAESCDPPRSFELV
jgi:hypothetical protein